MSNTSDLDAAEASIRELIANHDLRLLDASFSSPDVFIDEDVSLVELLDAIAAAAPSFVSLKVARFEAGEFEQQMDEVLGKQREAVSEEGRALIRQHRRRNGQVQDLALQWAADGVIYAFFAVADWHAALTEAVEESASEADDYDEEQAAQRARTRELVAQLEALPEFRAVAPTKRRAKGDQLLDSLLTQEGDFSLPFLGHIVRAAVSQAAVNAEEALAGIDLAEFASDPRWRGMRTQAGRTDFIERALLERTGYGVVRSTADAFRRRVDNLAGR